MKREEARPAQPVKRLKRKPVVREPKAMPPVAWAIVGGLNKGAIGEMVILPPPDGNDTWTIVMMVVLKPGNRNLSTVMHHMVRDVPLLLNSEQEPRYPGTSKPKVALLRVAGDNAWLVMKATDRDVLIETAALVDGMDALRAWEEHEAVQQALAPSTQQMIHLMGDRE